MEVSKTDCVVFEDKTVDHILADDLVKDQLFPSNIFLWHEKKIIPETRKGYHPLQGLLTGTAVSQN